MPLMGAGIVDILAQAKALIQRGVLGTVQACRLQTRSQLASRFQTHPLQAHPLQAHPLQAHPLQACHLQAHPLPPRPPMPLMGAGIVDILAQAKALIQRGVLGTVMAATLILILPACSSDKKSAAAVTVPLPLACL